MKIHKFNPSRADNPCIRAAHLSSRGGTISILRIEIEGNRENLSRREKSVRIERFAPLSSRSRAKFNEINLGPSIGCAPIFEKYSRISRRHVAARKKDCLSETS